MDSALIAVAFIAYLVLMMVIGIIAYRRTANLSDYILGGRGLGPWTAAISAGASDMSGWLLLGLPGAAYVGGLSAAWIGVGLIAGVWLNWLIVAKRLRVYTEAAGDSLTVPEYLSKRFHDTGHALRVISAVFILVFFMFYTSSGLVAGGKLFNTVFEWDYTLAVTAGTLAVVSYTFLGGFLAVSWTDLIQGLMMVTALVIVPIVAIFDTGGLADVSEKLQQENPEIMSWLTDADTGQQLTMLAIIGSLAWGLGYFGQPHIVARFAAIRSPKDVKVARRIAVTWTAIGLVAAMAIGLVGRSYVPGLVDGETVFITMVQLIFHPAVAGVLLAAILAAVMSTADSQLLVSSSALTDDFYKALIRPGAGQRELVWVGRATVIGVALIAYVLALDPESSVLELVSYAWAGFGAAFGPALILSLYWRRMNKWGALAGVLVGGLTVVIWAQLDTGIFVLYEIVPGFILSWIAIMGVSLLTRPPSEEVVAEFDRVQVAVANDEEVQQPPPAEQPAGV